MQLETKIPCRAPMPEVIYLDDLPIGRSCLCSCFFQGKKIQRRIEHTVCDHFFFTVHFGSDLIASVPVRSDFVQFELDHYQYRLCRK